MLTDFRQLILDQAPDAGIIKTVKQCGDTFMAYLEMFED